MNYKIQRPPLTPTFDLPSRNRLLEVKPGWLVKLTFTDKKDNNGERMWVKITDQPEKDTWQGTLENKPAGLKIKLGQKIEFHPLDSINIMPPIL